MIVDISGYQYCDSNGLTHKVENMTVEQLQQALCQTIDVLEELDSTTNYVSKVILDWRGL